MRLSHLCTLSRADLATGSFQVRAVATADALTVAKVRAVASGKGHARLEPPGSGVKSGLGCPSAGRIVLNPKRGNLVRNLKRFRFEQLERDLLRQHDIAYGKAAFRHETQHMDAPAHAVEPLDVHLHAMTNAV